MTNAAGLMDSNRSDLRSYLRVVRRQVWIVALATILVASTAVAISLLQDDLYEGQASVLLSRQNLAATLTGTPEPTANYEFARIVDTQARIASSLPVAERTVRAAEVPGLTPTDLLEDSSVTPVVDADLLDFRVMAPEDEQATELATAYARAYTQYRRSLDTASLARARREASGRLERLRAEGRTDSPLYESLVDKEQQIRTIEALQTSNAFLIPTAASASKVRPTPLRNGALGLILGLVLGVGLAFLRSALDTRVRSADELHERLALPLLARLPEPSAQIQEGGSVVMHVDPHGHEAEPYRMLRTNVDFAILDRSTQVIGVTSALEGEGKSTTAANLAAGFALAGKRVVLLDFDLRRPVLARFFDLKRRPGVTQAVLGQVSLGDAVSIVDLDTQAAVGRSAAGATGSARAPRGQRLRGEANGNEGETVRLGVLPAGPLPPDPGEFAGAQAVADLFRALRDMADVVVVDTPPLLPVSDTVALSANLDAVLLVTRLNFVRRGMLNEVQRLLASLRCPTLGFIVTGAEAEDDSDIYNRDYYRYYGSANGEQLAVGAGGRAS